MAIFFSFLFFPLSLAFLFFLLTPFQEIFGVFRIFLVRCVIFFFFFSLSLRVHPRQLVSLLIAIPLSSCPLPLVSALLSVVSYIVAEQAVVCLHIIFSTAATLLC